MNATLEGKEFHKASSRGFFDFGWLQTYHSFSFGNYYDPQKVRYGALRVLNDDRIAAGMGFGTHPHENMEIITIPLEGTLAHKDSMGNVKTIQKGEVQIMSAGTGITHSEFNALKDAPTSILQIWVLPKEIGIEPRYGQKYFSESARLNKFHVVVSPQGMDESPEGPVWINQDAYFSLGNFDKGFEFRYEKHISDNLVYSFLIGGKLKSSNIFLESRDGFGSPDAISWIAEENSEVLVIEIPGN